MYTAKKKKGIRKITKYLTEKNNLIPQLDKTSTNNITCISISTNRKYVTIKQE
jgi:hypothetical protein